MSWKYHHEEKEMIQLLSTESGVGTSERSEKVKWGLRYYCGPPSRLTPPPTNLTCGSVDEDRRYFYCHFGRLANS